MDQERNPLLSVYEHETEAEFGPGERLFRIIAMGTFAAFGAFGWYLHTHNPPPQTMEERAAKTRQVSFIIEEKKKAVAPVQKEAPKPVAQKVPEKNAEPIDLTKKPVLNQKIDDVKPQNPPEADKTPVRRVYGLRKVYSTGLGEGGDASQAVIGKLGNTLATDIDTIAATKKELKGTLVPVVSITKLPVPIKIVKPECTKEMRDAGVDGIIRAQVLVDIDGKVVQVKIFNDLGHGTREQARLALLQWIFEPAKRGTNPVAAWITVSIKFEYLAE